MNKISCECVVRTVTTLINFGLIQFSAGWGMKPLSWPSVHFRKRSYPINVLLWSLSVATAATVYQEPHFWRTEGQEPLHLGVTQKFSPLNSQVLPSFRRLPYGKATFPYWKQQKAGWSLGTRLFESIAMHDLIQYNKVQFLEFMGGSNLLHAHSICMCFIHSSNY